VEEGGGDHDPATFVHSKVAGETNANVGDVSGAVLREAALEDEEVCTSACERRRVKEY
jgi:hypothetical protein